MSHVHNNNIICIAIVYTYMHNDMSLIFADCLHFHFEPSHLEPVGMFLLSCHVLVHLGYPDFYHAHQSYEEKTKGELSQAPLCMYNITHF